MGLGFILVLGRGRAVGRTECEGAGGVNDSLVASSVADQPLVIVPEVGAVHAVVDVGEQVTVLERRRHELDPAGMEWVVEDRVPHLESLQLAVEVPVLVRLEHLIYAT